MERLISLLVEHINELALFIGVLLCTPVLSRLLKILSFYLGSILNPYYKITINHYHNGNLVGSKSIRISTRDSIIEQLREIKRSEESNG
ncbi:hypothetical protein [Haemophilus sp. HMSC061E01]|jgi:hypothetical protein|uniref:hypothetical protein n=1 Tax=Haemophilus sp. HMSC061E01 TaxID=1715211 RepID=UPI0011D147D2|nr:hypothetical protein [Haemophilus sp. HMSC061E01]DAK16705.1 MAG TPA: hypothetical protein [Caudoviricetes sp.]DAO71970.1 MAG TPA: hypothetical protein [Bacteriophage sp.]